MISNNSSSGSGDSIPTLGYYRSSGRRHQPGTTSASRPRIGRVSSVFYGLNVIGGKDLLMYAITAVNRGDDMKSLKWQENDLLLGHDREDICILNAKLKTIHDLYEEIYHLCKSEIKEKKELGQILLSHADRRFPDCMKFSPETYAILREVRTGRGNLKSAAYLYKRVNAMFKKGLFDKAIAYLEVYQKFHSSNFVSKIGGEVKAAVACASGEFVLFGELLNENAVVDKLISEDKCKMLNLDKFSVSFVIKIIYKSLLGNMTNAVSSNVISVNRPANCVSSIGKDMYNSAEQSVKEKQSVYDSIITLRIVENVISSAAANNIELGELKLDVIFTRLLARIKKSDNPDLGEKALGSVGIRFSKANNDGLKDLGFLLMKMVHVSARNSRKLRQQETDEREAQRVQKANSLSKNKRRERRERRKSLPTSLLTKHKSRRESGGKEKTTK